MTMNSGDEDCDDDDDDGNDDWGSKFRCRKV